MNSLARFTDAQKPIYHKALAELVTGRKQSHWMWFMFPQLKGLGQSPMSQHYGIQDLAEAKAYQADPVLGDRLRECVAAVLKHAGSSTAHQIFGSPDDLKFRSCLTLFETAAPAEALFHQALDAFYQGQRDPRTVDLLKS